MPKLKSEPALDNDPYHGNEPDGPGEVARTVGARGGTPTNPEPSPLGTGRSGAKGAAFVGDDYYSAFNTPNQPLSAENGYTDDEEEQIRRAIIEPNKDIMEAPSEPGPPESVAGPEYADAPSENGAFVNPPQGEIPPPGGGSGGGTPDEAPVIESLDPMSAVCLGEDVTLTVTADGINESSVIVFDGEDATTTFADGTLTTTVLASTVSEPEIVNVTVRNGTAESGPVAFEFTAPVEDPEQSDTHTRSKKKK